MINKAIKFNSKARRSVVKGVNILANSVKTTLGPQGHCVIIGNDKPKITKDGVSITKEIQVKNKFENVGVQIMQEVASKTLESVGDSTTTSIVLSQALINLIYRCLLLNRSPLKIREGLDVALKHIIKYIDSNSKEVDSSNLNLMNEIATISANNDMELGQLVGNVYFKIGKDGIVTIENSSNSYTSVKIIDGIQIDTGYISQHFVTDTINDKCVLKNAYVLVTEHKINKIEEIAHILNKVAKENRSLLIIASGYDDSVLETLKLNKLQRILNICAIKAPTFGEYRKKVLDDVATIVGAFNVSYDSGLELIDSTEEILGSCLKVIITKDSTIIINGSGDKNKIDERVQKIKNELNDILNRPEQTGSTYIDFLKLRIAKMHGGVAIIFVGGSTELELQERKDRIDDAVHAVKAALDDGVSIGGGKTFINASKSLDKIVNLYKGDIKLGIRLMQLALLYPFFIIAKNADFNPMKIYKKLKADNFCLNAKTGLIVDMYKEGIIDPSKALKMALENSVSISKLFLMTDCVIVPEEQQFYVSTV